MKIEDLTLEERETHLNMTADDHGTWYVYTDDPYWIRRLDPIAELERQEESGGKHYRLDRGQVTIRKKRAPMTGEQKRLAAQRLAAARLG